MGVSSSARGHIAQGQNCKTGVPEGSWAVSRGSSPHQGRTRSLSPLPTTPAPPWAYPVCQGQQPEWGRLSDPLCSAALLQRCSSRQPCPKSQRRRLRCRRHPKVAPTRSPPQGWPQRGGGEGHWRMSTGRHHTHHALVLDAQGGFQEPPARCTGTFPKPVPEKPAELRRCRLGSVQQ